MSAEHESSENIPRDQEVEERFGTINAALRDIVADHVKDLPKDVGDDLWTKVNSLTETGAIDITEVFERANGIELEVQLRKRLQLLTRTVNRNVPSAGKIVEESSLVAS